MPEEQQGSAEDLSYRIPPKVARKLVKLDKDWDRVREYLDLYSVAIAIQLKNTDLEKGVEFAALQAAEYTGAHKVLDALYFLTTTAKEVMEEYNNYKSALENQG